MRTLLCAPLFVIGASLMTGGAAFAAVTSSFVNFGSCSPVVNQGCQALAAYVTGDGAGGTIHTVDFNGGTITDPNGVITYSGGAILNGASAPSGDTSNYLDVNGTFTETLTFSSAVNYFGLYWGSVDAGNTITIKNGSTTLLTFTGSQITGGDSYVSFNGTGGTTWNTVLISNSGCCFETDNHAYVLVTVAAGVPEPADFYMITPAVVSLGFYLRRRRRA